MEIIDFNYIKRIIEDIKNEYLVNQPTISQKHKKGFKRKIYNLLPRTLQDLLKKFYKKKALKLGSKYNKDFFYIEGGHKGWSINFLQYIIEKGKGLSFDMDLFEKSDKEEIKKFIRNKIYLAIFGKLEKNKLFDEIDLKYIKRYNLLAKKVRKKGINYVLSVNNHNYTLPENLFEVPLFFNNYGLVNLPHKVTEKLKGTDFIDGGAFIGDSALILSLLKPQKIYSFEPDKFNFNKIRKLSLLNNLKNIVPVKMGLGDKNCKLKMNLNGCASYILDSGSEEIELTTIDSFSKKHHLNVGLIKMDIEGLELEAIQGAEKTIRKNKPVLLISLYHTGKDFFEIPPLIKKWVPKYTFRFLNLEHSTPASERVLLAYID